MFKHVLIATDGSEISKSAVRQGLDLAARTKATATVVRVSLAPAHIVIAGVDLTELPASVKAEIARQIEAHFEWVRQIAAAAGARCDTIRIEAEHVADGILNEAAKRNADLIVMGKYGRRRPLVRLLGSETQHVLARAPVPVLVIR